MPAPSLNTQLRKGAWLRRSFTLLAHQTSRNGCEATAGLSNLKHQTSAAHPPQLKLVRYPRSLALTLVALPSMSLLPIAPLTWQCPRHLMGRCETDSGNLHPGRGCFLVACSRAGRSTFRAMDGELASRVCQESHDCLR